MAKKILIFTEILLGLVFIFAVFSGLNYAQTSNFKEFDNSTGNYGVITIKSELNQTLAIYQLNKNTDLCFRDCYAEGNVSLFFPNYLFDGLTFIDLNKNKSKEISSKIYLQITENKSYNWTCQTFNETDFCRLEQDDDGNISLETTYWKKYKNEFLSIGNYTWKIKGKKEDKDSIEWIVTAWGVDLTEWAGWGAISNWSDNFDDNDFNDTKWKNQSLEINGDSGVGTFFWNETANDYYQSVINVTSDGGTDGMLYSLITRQDFYETNYTVNMTMSLDIEKTANANAHLIFSVCNSTDIDEYNSIIGGDSSCVAFWLSTNAEISKDEWSFVFNGSNSNATLYEPDGTINMSKNISVFDNNVWHLYIIHDGFGGATEQINTTFKLFQLEVLEEDDIPNVTINYPLNQNYSTDWIQFNLTVEDTDPVWCNYSIETGDNLTMSNDSASNFWATNTSIADGYYIANFTCSDGININNSESIGFQMNTYPPNLTIDYPTDGSKLTSKTFNINITVEDDIENGYCRFNITRGASTEVANTEIADCSNTSATVTSDADYVLNVWVNDTAGNINSTNVSFEVDTSVAVGPSGGGGGRFIVDVTAEGIFFSCKNFAEIFNENYDIVKMEGLTGNILRLWYSFWEYVLCVQASSIVPFPNVPLTDEQAEDLQL